MRFHLTEEQDALQQSLSGALARALPRARLHACIDGTADFDATSWAALMALGLGGLTIPEEHGGLGLGLLEAALAAETLGEAAAIGPFLPHLLAGLAIATGGDPATRHRFLPAIAAGETIATIAFGAEGQPQGWTPTLDDGRVTGNVAFIEGGSVAGLFLVGLAGGGIALIEPGPGVVLTPLASADRSRRLSAITLDAAPALAILPPACNTCVLDAGLVLLAADALGGADHCLDLSVIYAKEREQFGQPIGRFQAVKHQLAQMALEVEPARALVWYAAYAQDAALPDSSRVAALAKAHLADRFVAVARAAVLAHGGIGYSWDYGLNIWFRRSLFDRAYLGGPTLHRERAAAMARW